MIQIMIRQWFCIFNALAVASWVIPTGVLAFQSSSLALSVHQQATTNTALYGILGRFRKKRKVDQVATIRVGDKLPIDVDIERLVTGADGKTTEPMSEPVSILDVLGPNKALLIGMPGAFTTTCSTEHLPGFVKNAKKIQSLGVDTIAVVTTNDRFVNQEWGAQQGLITSAQDESGKASITMLCDADGDFVKSIGLADDMGFGVGIRSKRFAMITDNGVVQTLLTDEGMDDCSATSAANVIKVLSPESVTSDSAIEIDGKVILGVAGGIVALLAVLISGGDGGSAPSPAPKPTKETPNVVVPQKARPSSDSNFSLLNEYMKQ